jgi:hypothetical protein
LFPPLAGCFVASLLAITRLVRPRDLVDRRCLDRYDSDPERPDRSMPRKSTSKSLSIFRAKPRIAAKPRPAAELGALPEWNLEDLYPSMDSAPFAGDLAKAAAECKAFNAAYKGKLEALAKKAVAAGLLQAIRRYEALEELLGRIMAYAGLVYAENTTDPARMKFYGDAQEKVTNASSDLLFFELELNRLDDKLAAKLAAGPLKHFRPSPTSSTINSNNCSMKNRSPVMAPGTGCSTRPSRAYASTSMASSWRSSRCSI